MAAAGLNQEKIQGTIQFHGHSCPGLALGIRAAELALNELGRASDEEIVAVVETDMCGVDAIQYLTGCTFGKGNLIHLDYGKNAFTFWRRSDGKGIRIVTRPEAVRDPDDKLGPLRKKMQTHGLTSREQDRLKAAMSERIRRIMSADWNDLFHVHSAQGPIPKKARIMDSLTCQSCGEAAMESRTRRFLGQTLCIPCFEAMERRQG